MSKAALDVLFVEDSETDTKLTVNALSRGGFNARWQRVETAAALEEALQRQGWHLVISDSSLPRLSMLEALGRTKALAPDVPFIVVSGSASEQLEAAALRSGAADYIVKGRLDRLGPAVVRALSGGSGSHGRILSALHDHVALLVKLKELVASLKTKRGTDEAKALDGARSLTDQLLRETRALSVALAAAGHRRAIVHRAPAVGNAARRALTPRQREILELVALGHSTKDIARRLRISIKTVDTHRAQIMERLEIHHVAGLVHYAIREGIVGSDRER